MTVSAPSVAASSMMGTLMLAALDPAGMVTVAGGAVKSVPAVAELVLATAMPTVSALVVAPVRATLNARALPLASLAVAVVLVIVTVGRVATGSLALMVPVALAWVPR